MRRDPACRRTLRRHLPHDRDVPQVALVEAINSRRAVEFIYDGHPRVVQPAAVGVHKDTGNIVLRGYQVEGSSKTRVPPLWDLFLLSKIVDLRVVGEEFSDNPPGYKPGDRHMARIHAQL